LLLVEQVAEQVSGRTRQVVVVVLEACKPLQGKP